MNNKNDTTDSDEENNNSEYFTDSDTADTDNPTQAVTNNKTNSQTSNGKFLHPAYTINKKPTVSDHIENLCLIHNINYNLTNNKLDKISKLKKDNIKTIDLAEFDEKEIQAIKEIASIPNQQGNPSKLTAARYFVAVLLKQSETTKSNKQTHNKRKNDENEPNKPKKRSTKSTLEDTTPITPTTDQNRVDTTSETLVLDSTSTSVIHKSHVRTTTNNTCINNQNLSRMQDQIEINDNMVITFSGANLTQYVNNGSVDDIKTRENIRNELEKYSVNSYKHCSFTKLGTTYECRLITTTKEAAQTLINKKNTIFGGISIISHQSQKNQLTMKFSINRMNNVNLDDIKELENLRMKHGVLNIKCLKSDSRGKKYKIELCNEASYFRAYINGLFIGNDKVNCYPNWRQLKFCLKCCEWDHIDTDMQCDKLNCYKCGESHDGRDCQSEFIRCHHCTGDHEAYSNQCETFKSKFQATNAYIFDLLKNIQDSLSFDPINVIIPRNHHIEYEIKSRKQLGSTITDNVPILTELNKMKQETTQIFQRLDSLETSRNNLPSQIAKEVASSMEIIKKETTKQIEDLKKDTHNQLALFETSIVNQTKTTIQDQFKINGAEEEKFRNFMYNHFNNNNQQQRINSSTNQNMNQHMQQQPTILHSTPQFQRNHSLTGDH
jgi:hypothetical protein